MSKKNNISFTYCNPLPIPDIPRGKDGWYDVEKGMFSHENRPENITWPDYRSISDPTVMYHDGKWYLYPSYGMAWVTEDFQNWEHFRTEPYCPKYSPTIIPWKDKFLLTGWYTPLYISDNPLGPFDLLGDFIMPDGTEFTPCDPGLFIDDDGRIYMYAFASRPKEDSCFSAVEEGGFICQTIGYELDADDPRKVVRGPVTLFEMQPEKNYWERLGYHAQNPSFGWIEGPHMLKHNGRYYLIYAAPDTINPAYCMAVYYSDTSPLDDFKCQKRNPLTEHRHGIVGGAGHGCVEHGPNNTLWAFYTISTPYTHMYERRIGMDLVDVDENGELYCPHGVTDTPQYIPGYCENAIAKNAPDYPSLTGWCRPIVSSHISGRDGLYATDESSLTWWQPADEDPMPTLTCDLRGKYSVAAVRIFWKENGLDYQNGVIPGPMQYIVEGFCDGQWFELLNRCDSDEEKNIDYQTFSPKTCTQVRLKITGSPQGIKPGVIDFAVFGVWDA